MRGVRERALARAATPAAGGDETAYLDAFLDERMVEMHKEAAHDDVSRIETAQRAYCARANIARNAPLRWSVYGDDYSILG
jgi:chitosanase